MCCLLSRQIFGRRGACFVGPGRCVCRWAAARPRDRHTRAFGSEWSISKPGQALPPPTGTAAGPRCPPHRRCGATTAYPHGGQALLWSLRHYANPSNAVWPRGGLQSVGTRCLFVARTVPAAAYLHRGRALLWSLRHYANPSNNERPGPQPHKQTLNNVRTRPVVQCLPMGRCAYPRLGLLVWAVHPIRRHCTRSERVQRHVTGVVPRNGCSATCVVEALAVVGLIAQWCYAT